MNDECKQTDEWKTMFHVVPLFTLINAGFHLSNEWKKMQQSCTVKILLEIQCLMNFPIQKPFFNWKKKKKKLVYEIC